MGARLPGLTAAWLCCRVLLPQPGAAQGSTVAGTVVDATTGTPIPGGTVRLVTEPASPPHSATTDARGSFRIDHVAEGTYRVVVIALGYAPGGIEALPVASGPAAELRVALQRIYLLEEQVVTPDRGAGSTLGAPTALSVVDGPAIRRTRAVGGPIERLQGLPGVDVAQKGMFQRTFAARGPGGVNSGALLVLTDDRLASVPSLRFNVPYLVPTDDEDLERIEVVRGPGSALYGPDADRGVVHLVTSSPLERQGSAVSLWGGNRSLAGTSLRHATRLGERLGLKLSGQYQRADDWEFTDPAEVVRRERRLERGALDLRADWLATRRTILTLSGGVADAFRMVDQTEVGGVQLHDWRYGYLQTRIENGALTANLYLNASDAGRSVFLRTGGRIVDHSSTLAAQVQYASRWGARTDLRYGLDVQRVIPRTGGTVHGRNEPRDDITQTGGYVSALARLAPRLDLIFAARADHHDRLDDFAVSPRIGVVFRPAPAHALRLTYNRATSTPVPDDLFLDLEIGPLDPSLPYVLRGEGLDRRQTFRRDCGGLGGLCMHSPFISGAVLPADATRLWPVVQQVFGTAVAGIAPPTSQEVGTVLAILDPDAGRFTPVSADQVRDIPPVRRSFTSAFELGYRGQPARWLTAAAELAHTRIANVGSALTVETPNAFLNPTDLAAYLVDRGKSREEAAALADRISRLPLGVITPEQAADPEAVLLYTRQGGAADYWNLDLEARAAVRGWLALHGSFSWVSRDRFRGEAGLSDLALNAPRSKGSAGVLLALAASGATLDLRARWVAGFPVRSGVYQGRVKPYGLADLSIAAPIPGRHDLSASLSVTNLFDRRHQEFLGSPAIGRSALVRLRYAR